MTVKAHWTEPATCRLSTTCAPLCHSKHSVPAVPWGRSKRPAPANLAWLADLKAAVMRQAHRVTSCGGRYRVCGSFGAWFKVAPTICSDIGNSAGKLAADTHVTVVKSSCHLFRYSEFEVQEVPGQL